MRKYRTIQGDTWDLIAFRMYPTIGGEKLMDILIEANPDYVNTVIFPANIVLSIPTVNIPVITSLPAWKRG